MSWTLSRIRTKVRNLTGRLSINQLSNADILNYINDFYQEKLVAELNLPELDSWYSFNTSPNDENYDLSTSLYYTLLKPVYVNGKEINFFNDPKHFFEEYVPQFKTEDLDTGDGSTKTFTGTTSETPIRSSKFIVDDQVETFTDSSGTLTGDAGGTGTINYTTGAVSVTFNTAPTDGQTINLTYEFFSTGVPIGMLYYNNELLLRPVPDEVYHVEAKVSTIPTALSGDSDTLTYDDWGPLVAYGAAKDILLDYEGITEAIKLEPEFKRLLALANRRFIRQNPDMRAVPVF